MIHIVANAIYVGLLVYLALRQRNLEIRLDVVEKELAFRKDLESSLP